MDSPEPGLRPLVTVGQLTQCLQVSRRTICRLRRSEHFPAPVLVGFSLRWRPEDIEVWLANGGASVPTRREPSPGLMKRGLDRK